MRKKSDITNLYYKAGNTLEHAQIRTECWGLVRWESGYYGKCVRVRRMRSWSNMCGIEQNFIQSNKIHLFASEATETANNAHFDGPITIRSGLCSVWAFLKHMPQVVCAVHNGAPRLFSAVRTCACSSSWLKMWL